MFDLMPIAFKNVNQLWAYILTETLKRLGLTCVIICPGSRSTPLAIAFAQQVPEIEAISILDERSAAFFALGTSSSNRTRCGASLYFWYSRGKLLFSSH
jgi:2-succinyl-5-enolpyruvyl-6-hydroxy-3-cyclohexene-1-carboxylate synthase